MYEMIRLHFSYFLIINMDIAQTKTKRRGKTTRGKEKTEND